MYGWIYGWSMWRTLWLLEWWWMSSERITFDMCLSHWYDLIIISNSLLPLNLDKNFTYFACYYCYRICQTSKFQISLFFFSHTKVLKRNKKKRRQCEEKRFREIIVTTTIWEFYFLSSNFYSLIYFLICAIISFIHYPFLSILIHFIVFQLL